MQRWTSDPLPLPHYAEEDFARGDLEFEDVAHDGPSFTVLLYLNIPDVGDDVGRDPEQGFAGELAVFGHGDCWGDAGHCDLPTDPPGAFDRRAPHVLTPQNMTVEVTDALKRVRAADEIVVTAIAHSEDPDAQNLLRFKRLTLAVYE